MSHSEVKELFEGKWYAHPVLRNALISGGLTAIAYALGHLGLISPVIENALFAIAIPLGGFHWMREGIEELLKEKEVGIEILMLAATIGSIILRMADEAAFLVFLYGAAEGLEDYTYAKTRASIRKLLDLAPKEARVLRGDRDEMIPASDLVVGNVFRVKPGESLATDGVVVAGRSSVNEAPVTGESVPVEKSEGMKVFAATINHEGSLEIRVTATYENNTLAKMVQLVETAQAQKSKTQLFIEKFGRRYSPLVLVASLLLLAIPFFLGGSIKEWTTRAVVLLVAAAPCALVMSTPVAVAAGIGWAGRAGVLVKGGAHLEGLGKIRAVAFDKTGTLTRGTPVVSDVVPLEGSASDLLALAASVEKFSEHPLAQAIVRKAAVMQVEPQEPMEFSALVGAGARATVNGRTIYVGKPELFRDLDVAVTCWPQVETLRKEGKTVMLVGGDGDILGLLAIRDEIRPEAREAIAELHRMKIKVVMLTGDSAITADAVARELGIDEARADLKPEDKIAAVEDLEKSYGAVAMVGDGINDAPALARATVGIAMGVAGADAAIEAADTALMSDDLRKVVFALRLGKKARQISRQNIVFSLVLLAVLIPLALLGMMTVAASVFFHETSELLAVANGLRTAGAHDRLDSHLRVLAHPPSAYARHGD